MVLFGDFFFNFFFLLARGSDGFVFFGSAFKHFDVLRMLVHNACIPLLFSVCKLTFINYLFYT